MSFAQLKAEVPQLTDDQLDELAACIRFARKQRDPAWLERADRINAEMDAGKVFTEADLLRVHESLERSGQ